MLPRLFYLHKRPAQGKLLSSPLLRILRCCVSLSGGSPLGERVQGAHHKHSAEPEVGVDGWTDPQTQAQLLQSSLEAARAAPGQRKGRPQLLLDSPGNRDRGRSHTVTPTWLGGGSLLPHHHTHLQLAPSDFNFCHPKHIYHLQTVSIHGLCPWGTPLPSPLHQEGLHESHPPASNKPTRGLAFTSCCNLEQGPLMRELDKSFLEIQVHSG